MEFRTGRGERTSLLDAVVFDWDGTLADLGVQPGSVGDWRAAAQVLHPGDPAGLAERLFQVDQQVRHRMRDEQRAVRVEAIIEETARLLGLDPVPDVLSRAIDAHLDDCARRVVTDPTALDMLTDLRQAGFRTGLSADTTWPGPFCERLMARDGLHMQLDGRIYASDLGTCRPAVASYKAMLAVLDIYDPRRVVFVGDDVATDLGTAARMGMRTILVTRDHTSGDIPTRDFGVDAAVSRLGEIPGWVGTWS